MPKWHLGEELEGADEPGPGASKHKSIGFEVNLVESYGDVEKAVLRRNRIVHSDGEASQEARENNEQEKRYFQLKKDNRLAQLKLEAAKLAHDREEWEDRKNFRSSLRRELFLLVKAWMAVLALGLFAEGMQVASLVHFHLESTIWIALIGSLSVTVLGLLLAVVKSLYPTAK